MTDEGVISWAAALGGRGRDGGNWGRCGLGLGLGRWAGVFLLFSPRSSGTMLELLALCLVSCDGEGGCAFGTLVWSGVFTVERSRRGVFGGRVRCSRRGCNRLIAPRLAYTVASNFVANCK